MRSGLADVDEPSWYGVGSAGRGCVMAISGMASITLRRASGHYARLLPYQIEVDGNPVALVANGASVRLAVPPGRHVVCVRYQRSVSESVSLDLAAGEEALLVCGARPLMRNRFSRLAERGFLFVLVPIALVAFLAPATAKSFEKYLGPVILVLGALFIVGLTIAMPGMIRNMTTREAGAMIYLAPEPAATPGKDGDIASGRG